MRAYKFACLFSLHRFLEPARKRSKLVLPEPQISDRELETIIKVGQASEAVRSQVDDVGLASGPTQSLLNDYSVSTSDRLTNLRTPRTPALQDNILVVCNEFIIRLIAIAKDALMLC